MRVGRADEHRHQPAEQWHDDQERGETARATPADGPLPSVQYNVSVTSASDATEIEQNGGISASTTTTPVGATSGTAVTDAGGTPATVIVPVGGAVTTTPQVIQPVTAAVTTVP